MYCPIHWTSIMSDAFWMETVRGQKRTALSSPLIVTANTNILENVNECLTRRNTNKPKLCIVSPTLNGSPYTHATTCTSSSYALSIWSYSQWIKLNARCESPQQTSILYDNFYCQYSQSYTADTRTLPVCNRVYSLVSVSSSVLNVVTLIMVATYGTF